ncbi:MAG: ATP synthase F1 subunit delta [Gemmatimonadota bacterium]
MRPTTIARNYAEALFSLGEQGGRTTEYAQLIDAVAGAIELAPEVQALLISPRVPKTAKSRLLAASLPNAPSEFVRFLQAVVQRGRQGLFREIAQEYATLVDVKFNRVRAGVTLAREPDEALRESIRKALTEALGKEVLPSFTEDPAILGGTIVRVGERIYDGSVRRRMARLRRQLLS